MVDSGCRGSAAAEDSTRAGREAAAVLAVEIARASAVAKKHDIELAPEDRYIADWEAPCRIDPFSISIDQNLDLLLAIDAELRREPGITLAEASMNFTRTRQVFASSIGSVIDQTRCVTGAGFAALSYKDNEIQKRSYPNSFGGQHQLKGYELVEELDLLSHAPRIADKTVPLHSADQSS